MAIRFLRDTRNRWTDNVFFAEGEETAVLSAKQENALVEYGYADYVSQKGASKRPNKAFSPQQNKGSKPSEPVDATPTAVELAEANGIDIRTVAGTGKNGRVLKSDVEAVL